MQILLPLSLIFNKAIECGIFPECLKKCIVVPLLKTGDKKISGNYRPISLSLSISKIFDKCLKKRLYNFSKNQHGSQSGKSTIDVIVQADKYIRDNLYNNKLLLTYFIIINNNKVPNGHISGSKKSI